MYLVVFILHTQARIKEFVGGGGGGHKLEIPGVPPPPSPKKVN